MIVSSCSGEDTIAFSTESDYAELAEAVVPARERPATHL